MLQFRDILVTPFTDLLRVGPRRADYRGGPHWPSFETQHDARHQRGGAPVDEEPEPQRPVGRLEGTWAWAGPISGHFGHQLCEFSMRIAPTLVERRDARFVFAVPPSHRYPSIEEAPAFVRETLEWFGVPLSRCEVVSAPVTVASLVVAPQAEQLGGPGPSEGHLIYMEELTERRLGRVDKNGTVYVSRAGVATRFAGERALEDALRRCGVRIVRPETMTLTEQLRTYATARTLVFAEGSALFGPLLLGRSLGNVVVLTRRPGSRLARPSLRPRSTSLEYHDVIKEFIPGRNWRGEEVTHTGLTVLDDEALLAALDRYDIPIRRHWEPRRYADDAERDVHAHRAPAG